MSPFIPDNVYKIKNAIFNAYAGRRTHEDSNERVKQPIVGLRFDYAAHNQFVVQYVDGGRKVRINIDGAELGECHRRIYAFIEPGTEGDDWIVEIAKRETGRYLYRIALARNPTLVWTLNLPTEPANQIHLETRDEENLRQLWELTDVPGW